MMSRYFWRSRVALLAHLAIVAIILATGALTPWAEAAALDSKPDGPGAASAVVTGTHIRGAADSAFPITIYSRDVIEASGASTLPEFLERIPQNFRGGASENTVGSISGGGNAVNKVEATGVNLRGLGNDATLVLVNGHRVAPSNTEGNFVDVSMIPLYAVERIEIVTDGASAIYGSDAVGGVVNIILGRNLDGAESRVRHGTVDSGSLRSTQVGQTLGHGWDTGSALLIYDYLDRTPLSAASRDYTASAAEPFMLLPEQVRQSAFLSADQFVTPGIQLFAEGTYSHRSTYNDNTLFEVPQRTRAVIDAYSANGGGRFDLPHGAQLELSGTYAASETRYDVVPFSEPDPSLAEQAKSQLLSLDVKLDGSLCALPAGDVRFAVGAQFRQEDLDHADLVAMTDFRPDRHVTAGFMELRVPLLGPSAATAAAKRLELTVADRLERYSDFGSTNNPQLGLIWRPRADLKLRGTYGTSFRAPLLNDLNPVPFEVVPLPVTDPASGEVTNMLAVFGGNPSLQPEKARTWTAGVDFTPLSQPEVRFSATFYDIHFTNVVTDPEFSVNITNVLSQEALLGPSIIQRNPSAALVQQLAASPGFANFFGIDLSTIGAIFDSRVHNLSITRTRGVDVDGSWRTGSPIGELEFGLTGSDIFQFDTHFTPNASTVSILDTAYNPVDLRLRARAVLRRGGLTIASFVNYTDSYRETDEAPARPIASWTTVDLTAKYQFSFEHGALADSALLLAVTNALDKSPPFVSDPTVGINFDGANANALGRFFSVQLSKRW